MGPSKAEAFRLLMDEARSQGRGPDELDRIADRFLAERCPVHHALGQGGSVLARRLEEGGDPNETDILGTPALSTAAATGDVEAMELLIRFGADLDGKGDAPLVHATNAGQTGAIRYLLEVGADPNATNREGYTAAQRVPSGEQVLYDLIMEAASRRSS